MQVEPGQQQVIIDFINALSVAEVRYAYALVTQRLSAINRLGETISLQQYSVGERVAFHHNYQHIEGAVVRVNLRTVSVVEDSGRRWTVSPHYLQKTTSSTNAPQYKLTAKNKKKVKRKRRS